VADDILYSEGRLITRRSPPVGGLLLPHPLLFWQHPTAVTVPNNAWTPFPFNTIRSQTGTWSTYTAASTTIAAGSDAQALPQGTINVASNVAFSSTGYLVITIGGTDRIVRYTGKSGTTQFTGCTLGVGTMGTGNPVAQAQVTFNPITNSVAAAVAEVAWASNATGLRGIRFRFMDGTFNFPGGTVVIPAVAATDPLLHTQSFEQPATLPAAVPSTPLTGTVVEVYQSSGGNLDVPFTNDLAQPRLVAINGGSFTGTSY